MKSIFTSQKIRQHQDIPMIIPLIISFLKLKHLAGQLSVALV